MSELLKRNLVAFARSLGFERVGITSADPLSKEEAFLKTWLAEGRAGEMAYLERESGRRTRPSDLLPGAKSVVALAMSYASPSGLRPLPLPSGEGGAKLQGEAKLSEGKIARYARGKDYHKVIGKRLESLVRYIESMAPGVESRTFVDTGPLLERALARRAGLGFVGKNTMLIARGLGSWVFLAHVITTLDLPLDAPDERSCGECRLCIDVCPTGAITGPFVLDARRCIAYLTIESERAVPEGLRPKMGGWIFGCDVCQEVCPHNALRSASPQPSPYGRGRQSAGEAESMSLSEILSIGSDKDYQTRFAGTALTRAGRESLVRNACVAAANLRRTDLTSLLLDLSRNDSSPLVREHAAWALERLGASHASPVPPASIPDPVRP